MIIRYKSKQVSNPSEYKQTKFAISNRETLGLSEKENLITFFMLIRDVQKSTTTVKLVTKGKGYSRKELTNRNML